VPHTAQNSRTAYVNGHMVPLETAKISAQDRGFMFGDGIYEVTAVAGGKLIDYQNHAARLARSLAAIDLACPVSDIELLQIHRELVTANHLNEGLIYLQITRGAADRDFGFPANAQPTLVMFTQAKNVLDNPAAKVGIKVISTPDLRWKRCDIKSVSLLAQVLAKQEAVKAGAQEAWMVADGFITEGSASTAYIIKSGEIITTPKTSAILPGVTRQALLHLVANTGLKLTERPFTLAEAYSADEAFITAATNFVMPVVSIDSHTIGTGTPGPQALKLRAIYIEFALKTAL